MAELLDAGAVAGLAMPAPLRFRPWLQPICGACSSQFSMSDQVYFSTPALIYLHPLGGVFCPGVGRRPMPALVKKGRPNGHSLPGSLIITQGHIIAWEEIGDRFKLIPVILTQGHYRIHGKLRFGSGIIIFISI